MPVWIAIPFFRIVLPLILGVWFADYIHIPLPNWMLIAYPFLLVLVYMAVKRSILDKRVKTFLVLVQYFLLFALGMIIVTYHTDLYQENHFSKGEFEYLEGIVSNVKEANYGYQAKLSVQYGISDSTIHDCSGNIQLFIKTRLGDTVEVADGDQLIMKNKARILESPDNPFAFDYAGYLHIKNIHYSAWLNQDECYWQASEGRIKPMVYLSRYRKKLVEQLSVYVRDPQTRAVIMALTLGDKSQLTGEIRDLYAETGSMHVLAVSGLHVGIVAYVINWVLSFFWFPGAYFEKTKLGLSVAGIWAFALFTGASPSAMRAALLFSLVLWGITIRRYTKMHTYNLVFMAAFISILYNPFIIYEVGFQLSYSAVLAILFFVPKLNLIWNPKNRLLRFIWGIFTVGIAAQLGTAPLAVYYFHQLPVWFWLSGLVVIPYATLILPLSWIGYGVGIISTEASGWWLHHVVEPITWSMNSILNILAKLPGPWDGIWMSSLTVFISYLLIIAFGLWLNIRRRYLSFSILASTLILSVHFGYNQINLNNSNNLTVSCSKNELLFALKQGNKVSHFAIEPYSGDLLPEPKGLKYAFEQAYDYWNTEDIYYLLEDTLVNGTTYFKSIGGVHYISTPQSLYTLRKIQPKVIKCEVYDIHTKKLLDDWEISSIEGVHGSNWYTYKEQ